MLSSQEQMESLAFYEQYHLVFDRPLVAGRHIKLSDSGADSGFCRFCRLASPETTFRSVAHAVPEFLGNKSLVSQNECDTCNRKLAQRYEDDLSKWFGPMRAISQIKGKSGVPTYKDKDVRIEVGNKGLEIGVVTDHLEAALKFDGPFALKLPVSTPTQPYVPINAAKALVKIACSLCPTSLLGNR